MPHRRVHRRVTTPLAQAAAAWTLVAAGPSVAQSVPQDAARAARLNQRAAFSLFVLTDSGFTAGGYANYDDSSTASDFTIYNLPLRDRFQTGIGPIELRLTLGGGTATTTQLVSLAGPAGAVAQDRSLLTTWNGRIDIGRPIALTPELEFIPLVGLGYSAWTGKVTQRQAGAVPIPDSRVDLWANAMIYEAIGILEYHARWRDLEITPGIGVHYSYIDSFDGRANIAPQPGKEGGRAKASVNGASTLVRAGVRVEGPIGVTVMDLPLRWQTFVAGAYETSQNSLFPWAVEVGAALGADFRPWGRRVGLDPGALFVGASYVAGENLHGFRVNFGYRF